MTSSVIAVLAVSLAIVFGVFALGPFQEDVPKFKPSQKSNAKPDQESDPFEDFEGDNATDSETPAEDESLDEDPFENYEEDAAEDLSPEDSVNEVADAASKDPVESLDKPQDEMTFNKTVSKKPVTDPQQFGTNDLRGTPKRIPNHAAPPLDPRIVPQDSAQANLPPLQQRNTETTSSLPPLKSLSNNSRADLAPKQAMPLVNREVPAARQLPPLANQTSPTLPMAQPLKPTRELQPTVQTKPMLEPLAKPLAQPLVQKPNVQERKENQMVQPAENNSIMVDPNLAPATFDAPIDPVVNPTTKVVQPASPKVQPTSPAKPATRVSATAPLPFPKSPHVQVAKTLLKELQEAEQALPTAGEPMALLDMLSIASRLNRKQVIEQYWKTYGVWAKYRFAIDELQWIQQIGQPRTQADRALVEAAQSAANDEIAAWSMEMQRQQARLSRFVVGQPSMDLPIPSDKPLVTRYRTHFDLYATKRTMPEELKSLNDRLPKQYQLISDRAATVKRCRAAVMQSSREMSQGQSVSTVLQSLAMARESHSSFIDTVVAYNQDVAKYALAVKPYESTENVVAMLIPMPASRQMVNGRNDTGIRQSQLPAQQPTSQPANNGFRANPPTTRSNGLSSPSSFDPGVGNSSGSFGGSLPNRSAPTQSSNLNNHTTGTQPTVSPGQFQTGRSLPPTRPSQGLPPIRKPNSNDGGFRR